MKKTNLIKDRLKPIKEKMEKTKAKIMSLLLDANGSNKEQAERLAKGFVGDKELFLLWESIQN